MELQEILDFFLTKDNFTILTHKSPDGDTLGSGFALCFFLRSIGKHANVLNSDKLPSRYGFLFEGYEPQEFEEECVVAVDIADPNLIGSNLQQYQAEGKIDLCIDHHISNKNFAKKTYVDGKASAAAMIIYEILKLSGKPISDHIAKCLYTGISTDTGCFKYENTTPKTHIMAAELMQYDIDFANVNREMFDVKSRGRMEVEQTVINQMKYYFDGRCSMIVLTKKLMAECGVDQSEFDGLASIPLSVEGVEIGITVKERHTDYYKISVRTTDKLNASEFCKQFGGGGHIRAAGCEIRGTLEEVESKLLDGAAELFK
ncbi:MAG: bifunctional oligoribonuclease/PAP phosphatase NrnA [Ruminococcus sp.]|nr:bifunctional oligoribonuclease/PAP phosphatase NrnA [Ruminococcus sp.]